MKNFLLLLGLLVFSETFPQQLTAKDAFLEKWENSKNYLMAIADAMPEEHFDFKPTERQMSFKEQLIHIKGNVDWLSKKYFTSEESKFKKAEIPATKAEVLALFAASFDATLEIIRMTPQKDMAAVVTFFAGEKSKLQILNLLQDHVTHHRGQLVVYLNLKEIEPPRYVGW